MHPYWVSTPFRQKLCLHLNYVRLNIGQILQIIIH